VQFPAEEMIKMIKMIKKDQKMFEMD